MQIVQEKDADIDQILGTLIAGGLVVFPCETVYGIGCDCLNSKAVHKLSQYKQRPLGKPYAIMAANLEMAKEYVELNDTARKLYKDFLPGPLTVVSSGKHKVANGVESESGTLGVRIPDYSLMIKTIKAFGRPIVATSANASYKKRPYKVSDILENVSQKQAGLIDLIIDAGELPRNEPSTVIDTTMDDPVTLRQGGIVVGDQLSVVSFSEEQTRNIGKELWQKYEKLAGTRAIIFALEGPMGAGKTQFTKGLARAMGIKEEILSPTYSLELRYEGSEAQRLKRQELVHIDAWRMQTPDELDQLGLAGLIHDKSVIAIEWADRVADVIRKYNEEAVIVGVKIEYGKAENARDISWGAI